jgi:hypothetical protein
VAANLKDEEERYRRMRIVYERFIQTNESTRQIAQYITNSEDYNFKISNVTVSKYLINIKEYLNLDELNELNQALEDKKEKTVDNNVVKERVLQSAKYCLLGKTVDEIKDILDSSYWQVYRDLNYRLKQIDEELYENVKNQLSKNSLSAIQKR